MSDVTKEITAWMREEMRKSIAQQDAIDLPAVADGAAKHFAADPQMAERFMREHFRQSVYAIGMAMVAETRKTDAPYIPQGDRLVPRDSVRANSLNNAALPRAMRRTAWESWLENIEDNLTKPLLSCTRAELFDAADRRERRIKTEVTHIAFLRHLASQLIDGQKLGDRFSPDEIEAERERVVESSLVAARA